MFHCSCLYRSTNQDQQVDEFLQYEHEEWDNTENLSPGIDGCSENIIGGGVSSEVIHGENVVSML